MSACLNCSTPLAGAATIACDGCSGLIHLPCAGLAADDRITRKKIRSVRVYCNRCADRVDELNDLKVEIKNLTEKITSLERKVAQSSTSSLNGGSMEDIIAEVNERLKRSKNIIIRGVPEQVSGNDYADERSVSDLLDSFVSDTTPTSVVRLGRTKPGINDQPRPIKVTFSSESVVKKILKAKSRLVDPKYKRVKIYDDQTPTQLKQLQNLRDQLKGRQESGEKGLTIKYVKGVPRIVDAKK